MLPWAFRLKILIFSYQEKVQTLKKLITPVTQTITGRTFSMGTDPYQDD